MFIFFGSASWDFLIQRSRALAEALVMKGEEVVFVEVPRSMPGLGVALIGRKTGTMTTKSAGRVRVLKPPVLLSGFRKSITPWLDRAEFLWWWRRTSESKCLNPVVVISLPFWWKGFLRRDEFMDPLVIYDSIDDLEVFSPSNRILREMQVREARLIEESDIILYTASRIAQRLQTLTLNGMEYLPNGVDFEHFHKMAYLTPADVDHLPKPRVGFVGGIFDWVDLDLIASCALEMADVFFILVGPYDPGRAVRYKEIRNLVFLGSRDYRTIPDYVQAFDVCTIPFVTNSIVNSTDPIKIYEYLAVGKPVVTTDFPETRKFGDLIYRASSRDEYARCIRRALAESQEDRVKEKRVHLARESSWEMRAAQLQELVNRRKSNR